MPLYEFRCPAHGSFDRSYPMSTVPKTLACPDCGNQATRRPGGAPGRGSSPIAQAVEATRATAHEPGRVTQPPPRRRAPVARDRRQSFLPRP